MAEPDERRAMLDAGEVGSCAEQYSVAGGLLGRHSARREGKKCEEKTRRDREREGKMINIDGKAGFPGCRG